MKYYEIIFHDNFVDDDGFLRSEYVKEVIPEDKLEWYKDNVVIICKRLVERKERRQIL